jgi:hypothetical protein
VPVPGLDGVAVQGAEAMAFATPLLSLLLRAADGPTSAREAAEGLVNSVATSVRGSVVCPSVDVR